VSKQNYNHARKQKELARKARQQEKQQRRAAPRPGGTPEAGVAPALEASAPSNLAPGDAK
jgi:hypothetical protein